MDSNKHANWDTFDWQIGLQNQWILQKSTKYLSVQFSVFSDK